MGGEDLSRVSYSQSTSARCLFRPAALAAKERQSARRRRHFMLVERLLNLAGFRRPPFEDGGPERHTHTYTSATWPDTGGEPCEHTLLMSPLAQTLRFSGPLFANMMGFALVLFPCAVPPACCFAGCRAALHRCSKKAT